MFLSDIKRLERLKQQCFELFKFKDDLQRYKSEVQRIVDQVVHLKLNDILDSLELDFILSVKLGNNLSSITQDEFEKSIENFLKIRKTEYYFQIPELVDFPDNYQLGHGMLLTFDSLPRQVNSFAEDLAKGEITNFDPNREQAYKDMIKKIVIPADPRIGYWLKIITYAISSIIRFHNAFEFAEESLDILRITVHTTSICSPQYAIGLTQTQNKAFLAGTLKVSTCPYEARDQPLIDRLNEICVKPSSDLEKRIKNALHFFRIGDNFSPDYQKVFFYVAAIENLILGDDDRDVLRWKFSEKGAILLGGDLKRRLELSTELKKLYDTRSRIAHGGASEYDFLKTTKSRRHLHSLIMNLLYLIDNQGLRTVFPKGRKMGTSLDEYLSNIIYS